MLEIDKNINRAHTLPSDFYTKDDMFKYSIDIFEKSHQLICLDRELKDINVYPFEYFPEFLNENLVIVRQEELFSCLSNVCTHRAHLLATSREKCKVLQCRYHGRTFSLDGEIKNAPGFKPEILNDANNKLNKLPLFNWNGFLFISLEDDSSIIRTLSQIDDILPNFPYSDLVDAPQKMEYTVDCHWALYCDNYLEGFHIPYVHKGLNSDIQWVNYKTKILDEVILQTALANKAHQSIKYDDRGDIYAYYFFIFPNIMINYYNWGISINIVEPISKDKTRIKYMVYNLKDHEIPQGSSSSVDTVEAEDQEVVLSVQKGLQSRHYKSGKFSPEMERGVHYFHRLISKKTLNLDVK